MKPEIEFREHMREIVKDFPTMKTEIGGGEFEKKIKDQLFRSNDVRNSFESFEGNEEIMDQFQRFLKDKCRWFKT